MNVLVMVLGLAIERNLDSMTDREHQETHLGLVDVHILVVVPHDLVKGYDVVVAPVLVMTYGSVMVLNQVMIVEQAETHVLVFVHILVEAQIQEGAFELVMAHDLEMRQQDLVTEHDLEKTTGLGTGLHSKTVSVLFD